MCEYHAHEYTIAQSFFLLLSVATESAQRTFFGTLINVIKVGSHTRPTNVPPKMVGTDRAGRASGTLEYRGSGHRTAPLCSLRFLSDPFRLPTSSEEIGTTLLPCASLRSPPEPLLTNHNKAVVPTLASTVGIMYTVLCTHDGFDIPCGQVCIALHS